MDSVSQLLAVAFVLALLGVAVWRLRGTRPASSRLWPRARGGQIRVIERVSLTPQHSLHLVSLGSEILLLGAGPGGIELLRQRADDEHRKAIG
jgi:flagellar biogenesis protein FliO